MTEADNYDRNLYAGLLLILGESISQIELVNNEKRRKMFENEFKKL